MRSGTAGELSTSLDRYCLTCGARPRERCRAVVQRTRGHGQETQTHSARNHGGGWYGSFTAELAEEQRARLSAVWGKA